MFNFFKKKNPQDAVLKQMDGRQIKYVTKRTVLPDGNIKEEILGKSGRIVLIDGEIRVMCGDTDVFRCMAENAKYFTLLSGDGITISGENRLNGEKMDIIVHYTYHRK